MALKETAMDKATRDSYLDRCPGFGWDEKLGSEWREDSEECRGCKEHAPEMYGACVAEIREHRKAKEKEMEERAAAEAAKENVEMTEKATDAANVAVEQEQAADVVAEQEQAADVVAEPVQEAAAPKPKKKTVMDFVIEVLKEKKPMTAKELAVVVEKRSGKTDHAANTQVNIALSFGLRLGIVEKEEKKFLLVI